MSVTKICACQFRTGKDSVGQSRASLDSISVYLHPVRLVVCEDCTILREHLRVGASWVRSPEGAPCNSGAGALPFFRYGGGSVLVGEVTGEQADDLHVVGLGEDVEHLHVVPKSGDDRFYTKSYGPLHGIVQADVRLWQRLLAGEDGVAHVQGALPPGGATGSGKPRAGSTTPTDTPVGAQPEAPTDGGSDY